MIQKWTFVAYAMSAVALGYATLVNSPMRFASKSWENTSSPAMFFGLAVILIIHIVFTGKMLSQEKFRKVLWVSFFIAIFAGILLIPGVAMVPEMIHAYIG